MTCFGSLISDESHSKGANVGIEGSQSVASDQIVTFQVLKKAKLDRTLFSAAKELHLFLKSYTR